MCQLNTIYTPSHSQGWQFNPINLKSFGRSNRLLFDSPMFLSFLSITSNTVAPNYMCLRQGHTRKLTNDSRNEEHAEEAMRKKNQTRSFYSSKFIVKIDLSWNTLNMYIYTIFDQSSHFLRKEKTNVTTCNHGWTFAIFLFRLLNGTIWPMVLLVFFRKKLELGGHFPWPEKNRYHYHFTKWLGRCPNNIHSWTWCSLSSFGTM